MPFVVTLKLYMQFHKGSFCDITSSADDHAPYNFDFNLDNVISNLEKSANSLLNWFRKNHMKGNAGKYHLLV